MNLFSRLRLSDLRLTKLVKAWRYFAPSLRPSLRWMGGASACGAGVVAMQLLRPWPLKLIFDGLLLPPTDAGSGWLDLASRIPERAIVPVACFSLLAIALLWGLFSFGQAYLTARAGQTLVYALRYRVHSHLQRLSLNYHRRQQKGDLLMRLTGDINVLRDMLVNATLQGIASTLLLTTMLIVLLLMDWQLALIVVCLLPILGLATFRFSARIRSAARRQRQHEGRVAALIGETLSDLPLIQSFGRERLRDKQFQRVNNRGLRAGLRTTRLEASMARMVEILLAVGTATVFWLGVERVQQGVLTAGDLLVFIAYTGASFKPIRRLARVSGRLAKATVCAGRLREILRESPEVQTAAGAKRARNLRGRIDFRRVSFDYPDKRRALHRVSFEVEPGSTVAIVGPSGAGKSTLLSLLLRLHDPSRGRIRLDGRDLRRYQIESLRHQFSMVLQEPFLFGSSIRDNIAFGRPDASPLEIVRAAQQAKVDEFANALPEGLDTPLAEAGATLSAGQRQRIAIARALVRRAPILLLDEPTTGLDAKAESQVMSALLRLTTGRTTVMVAHKLATVQQADQILVLRRGRLVEQGQHHVLIAKGGWYARAWRAQLAEYPQADVVDFDPAKRLSGGAGS
ncbi:MAG: ABC transporter ATP-binding protein [Acidobacteria bacterium]|nr:ABC transporter ATP-binding protein [Acidobacteriota bacterium]